MPPSPLGWYSFQLVHCRSFRVRRRPCYVTFSNDIGMQGTVPARLKCSVSIDSIGKESLQNMHSILYKYKNTTSVPPLSLIDDILAVSICSSKSIQTNAVIQSKIHGKRLELGKNKCFQMHVGKTTENCHARKEETKKT